MQNCNRVGDCEVLDLVENSGESLFKNHAFSCQNLSNSYTKPIMQTAFWVFLGILIYIFFGYPIIVWTLSTIVERVRCNTYAKPASVRKPGEDVDNKPGQYNAENFDLPTVTLIIAAYNEAKIIKEKIFNTFELDYPKNKLQVIVFSDASTDHTDAIVKSFASRGIEFVRIEGRVGKTECQNRVITQATGDIVVFSDANSMYDPQAINYLVRNFADETIGCVVGELRYIKNAKSDEGLYWKFEQWLKRKESRIDSCLGANGSMYAIRKHLYVQLPADAISDFIKPFKIYEQGYRVIYEPDAFCSETVGKNKTELYRKRRIIARTFSSLKYISSFLNPLRYGWYSVSLWSHKVLRWFALVFMAGLFMANMFLLGNPLFLIVFIVQIVFYISALIGIKVHAKPFSVAFLFMVMHVSAILGIGDTIVGKKITTWKTMR